MTQRKNQWEHDIIIDEMLAYLQERNFSNIKADLAGEDQPDKICWSGTNEGHIPDITAQDQAGSQYIFEVETSDTIGIDHTESQWRLFSHHARDKNGVFIIVVPTIAKTQAEREIRELGIDADVWVSEV